MSEEKYDLALAPTQQQLANDMLAFLEDTPLNADLLWARDKSFLFHFETRRMLIVRDLMLGAGFRHESAFRILDFGYLHGLVQEFTHRFFPKSSVMVCDLPSSPIFQDKEYLEAIKRRNYLELIPCNINDLDESLPKYDLIMLGEIIEHLDPTQVAKALAKLRRVVKAGGVMIITTPNGAGLYNSIMTMSGRDQILHPPIPDAVMGYGHIHLWPLSQLKPTADHCGWSFKDVSYYHGREGEKFEKTRHAWSSLRHQVVIRTIKFLADRYPKLRGFYAASFTAT